MNHKTWNIESKNSRETKNIGKILGEEVLKGDKGPIIGLSGELGSGKTTFIQGLAKGLGIKDKITSPTFVIFKKYSIEKKDFYHVDCYRINDSKDLIDLDFKEILENKENIVVIEWAEKIKDILPKDVLSIKFEYLDEDKRRISL